jgi:hypothetical protein
MCVSDIAGEELQASVPDSDTDQSSVWVTILRVVVTKHSRMKTLYRLGRRDWNVNCCRAVESFANLIIARAYYPIKRLVLWTYHWLNPNLDCNSILISSDDWWAAYNWLIDWLIVLVVKLQAGINTSSLSENQTGGIWKKCVGTN